MGILKKILQAFGFLLMGLWILCNPRGLEKEIELCQKANTTEWEEEPDVF